MKIAHIAPPWITIPPQNYGGTENVIDNLIGEQVALGHDVTLFAPGDAKTSAKLVSFFPKSLMEDGVPWTAHLKAHYHIAKALEYAKEFDIVHTHLSSSPDLYIFPLTASLTTPHLTTLHSQFPFDRVQKWVGDADTYYIEEWAPSVPLVAISESARQAALSQSHLLNFAGVVHNGLPIEQFQPTGKKQGDFFVWLGKFVPEKGTHVAIEAAKQANVPIVLAGVIDRHSPKSVQYFQEEVKPLIDNEQVRYIGPVNMKQKLNLLSRARGFLNPIQWEEPFGMVMIEAMALGCPVISFARGAASEIIAHRETGFLIDNRNEEDNLAEMVHFISRVDEIDRNVTRMHVVRNFSAQAMAKKYMKIYEKLV